MLVILFWEFQWLLFSNVIMNVKVALLFLGFYSCYPLTLSSLGIIAAVQDYWLVFGIQLVFVRFYNSMNRFYLYSVCSLSSSLLAL